MKILLAIFLLGIPILSLNCVKRYDIPQLSSLDVTYLPNIKIHSSDTVQFIFQSDIQPSCFDFVNKACKIQVCQNEPATIKNTFFEYLKNKFGNVVTSTNANVIINIQLKDIMFLLQEKGDDLNAVKMNFTVSVETHDKGMVRKIFVNEEQVGSFQNGLMLQRLNNKAVFWLDKFIDEAIYSGKE